MKPLKFAAFLACAAALLWQNRESPVAPPMQAAQATSQAAALSGTVTRYCAGCHNSRVPGPATASGVVLDGVDLDRLAHDAALWEKVARKLRAGGMPPEGQPRPDRATHDALLAFIESRLDERPSNAPPQADPRSIE